MDNVETLPIMVSFDEAKRIFSGLHKVTNEDWAFGDVESYWLDEDGNEIASSYVREAMVSVWFTDNRVLQCSESQLWELNNCYLRITRSRNDSSVPYDE
jgi:hypothetical protein